MPEYATEPPLIPFKRSRPAGLQDKENNAVKSQIWGLFRDPAKMVRPTAGRERLNTDGLASVPAEG